MMNRNRHAIGGLPILSAALLSALGLAIDGALSGAAAQTYSGPSNEVIINYDVLNALPGQALPGQPVPAPFVAPGAAQPGNQPTSQFMPNQAPAPTTYGSATKLPPYAAAPAGLAQPPASGAPTSVLTVLGPDGKPITPIKLRKPGSTTAGAQKPKAQKDFAAPVQPPQQAQPPAEDGQVATVTTPSEPADMPSHVPMPEPAPPPPAPAAEAETQPAAEAPAPEGTDQTTDQAADRAAAESAPETAPQKSTEAAPAEAAAVEAAPAATPPAETPAAETPAAEMPAAETPAETPTTEAPAGETPAAEDAVADAPAAAAPAERSSETPSADADVAETQPEEQAAEEQPTEELAGEEQPAEEQPAEEQPAEEQAGEEESTEEAATEPAPDDSQPAPPIPEGGIRIVFPVEMNEVPAEANAALDDLAAQMQADETMRIQIMCYASGDEETESKARRRSLARCINIRQYLFKKDILTTRMDVRALGLKAEGQPADRVDIFPANS
jgi:hypothetical protein